uniref:Uncharacterized protein n=1 Tax=uncultured marine virus TaxID=186617 RepID=A0A0F7L762_9VIRU|nr:hypothetical protein [uncultured marine virus]
MLHNLLCILYQSLFYLVFFYHFHMTKALLRYKAHFHLGHHHAIDLSPKEYIVVDYYLKNQRLHHLLNQLLKYPI